MGSLSSRVEEIVPRMRIVARTWTNTQEQADDIVCRALELALKRLPPPDHGIEDWLFGLLSLARSSPPRRLCETLADRRRSTWLSHEGRRD